MSTDQLSINNLPHELLSTIFQYIQPIETLLAASCTCRLWRKIINNEWFLNKYFKDGISKKKLIGWWKFDDINNIGHDSSGVLGDRFQIFGRPMIEDCFLGKCAVFDGQSFIDLSVDNKSEYQTDVYSVAVWFWADSTAWSTDQREGGWRTAVGSWNDLYLHNHAWLHLGFHVDSNIHNQVMISPAQYSFICQDKRKMEPCRWYHVVVRVNRNRQELWINGQPVSYVDMTHPEHHYQVRSPYHPNWQVSQWHQQKMHLPDVLCLGSKNSEHHNPWIGKIADVSIWRRWLKPYEIHVLYQQRVSIDQVKLGTFVHNK
jgi:hypothetical protein